MKTALFTPIILFLFFASCNRNWNRFERMVQENPDSALILLQTIKPEQMHSRREKADYSLLLSMALDKCYIDISSDSLITPAVKFYSRHKPLGRRMLAYYYLGRVQANAHAVTDASFSFDKALQLAGQLEDHHYLGLIYQQLGDLYAYTYDREHQVYCFEKALDCFETSGEPLYLDNARIELAVAYYGNKQYEQSERLFQSLLQQDTMNSYLRQKACLCYARQLSAEGEESAAEALSFFMKGDISTYTASDFGSMAVASALSGDTVNSRKYFAKADSLVEKDTDKVALDFFRYKVAHYQGEDHTAIRYLRESVSAQDSLLRILVNQSVSAERSAYFKNEAEKQQHRNKTQRILLSVVVLLGSMSILFMSLRNRRRVKEDIALMSDIRQKLEMEREERNLLANSIIIQQVNALHLLTEEYYKSESRSRREKYFKAFDKMLNEFRQHDSELKDLEQSVNKLKGNALCLLKEEFPNETRHFYRMCTFYFAGFPYNLLHLLTKSSVSTLKAGKSHIRKRFIDSDAPHKDLFLTLLDSAERRPPGRPRQF